MRSLMVVALAFVSPLALSSTVLAKSKPHKTCGGELEAKSKSTLKGKAEFRQKEGSKEVTAKIVVDGVTPGEHAVHVHEKGDCSDPDGKNAGGHWNPGNEAHGQWGHDHFHLGDIGNMKVDEKGHGEITLTTDKWSIGTGETNDLIGHAVVVHEKVDDFTTQPTGNAGNRIGCAVIAAQQGTPVKGAAKPATGDKTAAPVTDKPATDKSAAPAPAPTPAPAPKPAAPAPAK